MPSVSGHLTRSASLGGGTNLEIEDAGTYSIVSVNFGGLSWRRTVATSPYQHGEFLVGATKDVMVGSIVIRCYGSTASDLESKVSNLLAAFAQFAYSVNLSIDGESHSYYCEPADVRNVDAQGTGAGFDKFAQAALQQVYEFKFPRSPIPKAGVF